MSGAPIAELLAAYRAHLAGGGLIHPPYDLMYGGREFTCVVRDRNKGEPLRLAPGQVAVVFSPDPSAEVVVYIDGDGQHPLVREVAEVVVFWRYGGDWDRAIKRVEVGPPDRAESAQWATNSRNGVT